jgi:hypothetical protein
MQSGPYLASLPAGTHTAHFRMAVSARSDSSAQLARLDVRENDGGTLLASREIAWNAFGDTNQPQDFPLLFTNVTGGVPLEFRVHWNHAADAPALTVTDVTLDGFHNWTAANLAHDVGRLDGRNAWEADPVRDRSSGYLIRGPGTGELPAGNYCARFELKVDNFNWDNMVVAGLAVVETDSGTVLNSRSVARSEFKNTLYHTFHLKFQAAAGKHYDFRTYWHHASQAPRLTQRSLVVARTDSYFTGIRLTNGEAVLTFSGVPWRTYTVQAASGLLASDWTNVGMATIPPDPPTACVTDTNPGSFPRRFYRISYP